MVVTTDSSAAVAVASMRLAFAKTFRASSAARRATLGEHSRAARIVFTCIVASDASFSKTTRSRSSTANANLSLSVCALVSAAASSASSCASLPILGASPDVEAILGASPDVEASTMGAFELSHSSKRKWKTPG